VLQVGQAARHSAVAVRHSERPSHPARPQAARPRRALRRARRTTAAPSAALCSTSSPHPALTHSHAHPERGVRTGQHPDHPAIQKQFDEPDCTKTAEERKGKIEPTDQLLVTCDSDGFKYILGPTAVEGTHLNGADAGLPQSGVGTWQVNLSFDGTGTKQFAQTTKDLVGKQSPQNQFAIVLDGQVVSAPVVQSEIPTGQAEITGNFSQSEAKDLANVLKYGALPLAFDQSELNEISPTLGSDYLRVGIIAGACGLALVALYLLIYYRGLGLVAMASLVIAGLLTYASVVLLGEWIGFTLTLAGIAGLIVAVGITADSFVVFFERLRDEVRKAAACGPRSSMAGGGRAEPSSWPTSCPSSPRRSSTSCRSATCVALHRPGSHHGD
jgi:preprotein translocase subunit SecD